MSDTYRFQRLVEDLEPEQVDVFLDLYDMSRQVDRDRREFAAINMGLNANVLVRLEGDLDIALAPTPSR